MAVVQARLAHAATHATQEANARGVAVLKGGALGVCCARLCTVPGVHQATQLRQERRVGMVHDEAGGQHRALKHRCAVLHVGCRGVAAGGSRAHLVHIPRQHGAVRRGCPAQQRKRAGEQGAPSGGPLRAPGSARPRAGLATHGCMAGAGGGAGWAAEE